MSKKNLTFFKDSIIDSMEGILSDQPTETFNKSDPPISLNVYDLMERGQRASVKLLTKKIKSPYPNKRKSSLKKKGGNKSQRKTKNKMKSPYPNKRKSSKKTNKLLSGSGPTYSKAKPVKYSTAEKISPTTAFLSNLRRANEVKVIGPFTQDTAAYKKSKKYKGGISPSISANTTIADESIIPNWGNISPIPSLNNSLFSLNNSLFSNDGNSLHLSDLNVSDSGEIQFVGDDIPSLRDETDLDETDSMSILSSSSIIESMTFKITTLLLKLIRSKSSKEVPLPSS